MANLRAAIDDAVGDYADDLLSRLYQDVEQLDRYEPDSDGNGDPTMTVERAGGYIDRSEVLGLIDRLER